MLPDSYYAMQVRFLKSIEKSLEVVHIVLVCKFKFNSVTLIWISMYFYTHLLYFHLSSFNCEVNK